MSLFGQIKFVLNNDPPSVEKKYSPANRSDRRLAGRFSHKGRKILVVDDSATIVAMFGKLLRSAGCVVWEAADAETGLEIARGALPDIIFLDIVLPGMNGFAALRQIRRDPRMQRIPVVIISGNEQLTRLHANRIGAADFMRKPFSRHEIFARLDMLTAEGKLPKLDTATQLPERESEVLVSAMSEQSPHQASTVSSLEEKVAAENPLNVITAGMTVLEARRQLASMGLQYFSQEQFSDALKRKDKLAVRLFVTGRGIKIQK
jgi:twitching motility two-component system response regulator PilH